MFTVTGLSIEALRPLMYRASMCRRNSIACESSMKPIWFNGTPSVVVIVWSMSFIGPV